MAGQTQRVLDEKKTKEFFEILGDPNYLDVKTLSKLFARSKKTGIRFYATDVIAIGPEESPFVKPGTRTTVGIYIMNKYVYERLGIFGYINKTLDSKGVGKVDKLMARALAEGDITRDQYGEFIDRTQWLYGGPLAHIINVSLSQTVLSLPPGAKKLKKELLEKNREGIEANDPQVARKVEIDVVNQALKEMRETGDPSLAIFDSGCGIDPFNQYKTIAVMKGAIQDNTGESPTGYKVITSNYDEGITKEDMPKIADAVVTTAYSTGVATQDSGTDGKKYNALLQRVRLQGRDSDCGTTDTIRVSIDADNADDYMYRYILEGSKLVMLTPDNMEKYIGKTVKMRSGIRCKAKDPEYCSRCVGDRPYRIGIRNIGFTYMTVSGSTLNASMKKKHDISIKTYSMTVEEVLKYVE